MLNSQYEKAIEDFQKANTYLEYFNSTETAKVIEFRTTFGKVVGYDNLGMTEETELEVQKLQFIA